MDQARRRDDPHVVASEPEIAGALPIGDAGERRAQSSAWPRLRAELILYLVVAAGAVVGGVLRAIASFLIPDTIWGFVGATLLVNGLGSFVIGFFGELTGPDGRLLVGPRQRAFVMVGFCGGFTTFSTFSLETIRLATSGHLGLAGLNLGLSIAIWLLGAIAGVAIAARINRLGGL